MPALAADVVYLAELTVYDAALPGTRVLRYATRATTTGPSETPANAYYDERLIQPAVVTRTLFSAARPTTGRSQVGYGDLVLANQDGALDGLIDYGFDGRSVIVRRGVPGAAYPGGYTTEFVGTMAGAEIGVDTVVIKMRDAMAALSLPLQATKYGGTNALPAGLDGTPSDLKGKPKPLLYGTVFNVAARTVNTSKLIYQIHDGALSSIAAVYDRGIALTAAAGTYATLADLQDDAQAPAQGAWKAYLPGGYFRLGSTPDSVVTADATEGGSASARTAAQIWTRVLAKAGKVAGDWSASDVAALDAQNSAVIGVYAAEEISASAALDMVAGSVGAWWGADRGGVLRIKRLDAPSGSPVLTIGENDMLTTPRKLFPSSPDEALPSWRTIVRYGKNYTPQQTDFIAGAILVRPAVVEEGTSALRVGKISLDASFEVGPITAGGPVVGLAPPIAADTQARYFVMGVNTSTTSSFLDEIAVHSYAPSGGVTVLLNTNTSGTPPARTYSMGSRQVVQLAIAGPFDAFFVRIFLVVGMP